jgi:hypothetical protein
MLLGALGDDWAEEEEGDDDEEAVALNEEAKGGAEPSRA